MENRMDFMRQVDLFNPINQRYTIRIFGAGSLGSFIALNLAKLGFNDITVHDYDRVEMHNIPNQFYRLKDIGKYKVYALKEIIEEFTAVKIETINKKITEETELFFPANEICILTFDTLEARKIIYDKACDFKTIVIDVRVGGEEYNIQIIDTFNKDSVDKWKESFNITPTELPCGAKSIIYTNLSVASEVCNIVKKINNDENYPKKLLRHMCSYMIINDMKGGN